MLPYWLRFRRKPKITPDCKSCKYFVLTRDEGLSGQCLRFPPQIYAVHSNRRYDNVLDAETLTEWPYVYVGQWCGEFKSK